MQYLQFCQFEIFVIDAAEIKKNNMQISNTADYNFI